MKYAKKLIYILLGLISLSSLFLIAFTSSYLVLDKIEPSSTPSLTKASLVSTIPRAYVIQSGSMEPAIKTASIVVSSPQPNYFTGDIITFRPEGRAMDFVTHRIEFKDFPNGVDNEPIYKTSGDANEDFDIWEVTNEQIVGKVVFSVPYLGYVADFAKKPQGFILLVIVPATIVIYEELRFLREILFKSLKKLKKKKIEDHKRRGGLPKIATIIPIFGAAILLIGLANSFFSDSENSVDNILSAWTEEVEPSSTPSPTPTPTPGLAQTLVINEVLPNPSCSQGNTEAQWIEFYNGFSFSVNPKNFKITDGTNTIDLVTANNLTIPAGGLLLLAHNSAIWNNCWEDNGTQTGNLGGTLNIDTGHLQLIGTDGTTVIDDVRWGDPTNLDPQQDESIARTPNGWDSAFGADFNENDFSVYATPSAGLATP